MSQSKNMSVISKTRKCDNLSKKLNTNTQIIIYSLLFKHEEKSEDTKGAIKSRMCTVYSTFIMS